MGAAPGERDALRDDAWRLRDAADSSARSRRFQLRSSHSTRAAESDGCRHTAAVLGGRGQLASIFVGGFAGAIARAELGEALPRSVGSWPWATFLANVAGAFLLGYLATRLRAGSAPLRLQPLIGSGFCGALTTFSTLQIELLDMLDTGRVGLAAAYAAVSIAAGFAAVALATAIATPAHARPAR